MQKNSSELLRPPIERLPVVAELIEGELTKARVQYADLQQSRSYPYVFSAPLVERVLWASLSQLDGANLFADILAHWKQETDLTHAQKAELTRLVQEVEQLKTVLSDSLTLAEQLQKGILAQVMTKGDIARVRAFLSKGF